jgi:hypothetical protein
MASSGSGLSVTMLGGLLVFAAVQIAAAADQVPVFDVNPTCRGTETTAAGFGRGPDVCRRTEIAARDQLEKEWSGFAPADRGRCVQLARMTNIPSYVQVLTCLEMAREARSLPANRERSTVGSDR